MSIDPQLVGESREIFLFCPILAPVARNKERKRPIAYTACDNIKYVAIGGVDGHCRDVAKRIRFRNQIFVRVIRTHFDALYRGRLWIYQAPSLTLILAAPQSARLRINHLL